MEPVTRPVPRRSAESGRNPDRSEREEGSRSEARFAKRRFELKVKHLNIVERAPFCFAVGMRGTCVNEAVLRIVLRLVCGPGGG